MPIAVRDGSGARLDTGPEETPAHVVDDWRQYKRTGSLAARNRLVGHFMKSHVRPLAARMHATLPNQIDLDDLVQQGYLGLIDAMDRYDPDRETRFETFSRRRVCGAMQDYLRAVDPVPRLARTRFKKLQVIDERFRKKHGRAPSEEELRPLLDMPEPTFKRFITAGRPAAMVPFSSVASSPRSEPSSESDAMDVFEDLDHAGPVVRMERNDLRRWLVRGFERRDRLIIILYYYEQMTMREIGSALGISESRVSQRMDSILSCLRARMSDAEAEEEFVFG